MTKRLKTLKVIDFVTEFYSGRCLQKRLGAAFLARFFPDVDDTILFYAGDSEAYRLIIDNYTEELSYEDAYFESGVTERENF